MLMRSYFLISVSFCSSSWGSSDGREPKFGHDPELWFPPEDGCDYSPLCMVPAAYIDALTLRHDGFPKIP